jgi:hypothetical protein
MVNKKETYKKEMRAGFTIYLLLTLGVILLCCIWNSVSAPPPKVSEIYAIWSTGIILAILVINTCIGLLGYKMWGRVLGIITSLIFAVLPIFLLAVQDYIPYIPLISHFLIPAIPFSLFYVYHLYHLIFSKKVKEVFK